MEIRGFRVCLVRRKKGSRGDGDKGIKREAGTFIWELLQIPRTQIHHLNLKRAGCASLTSKMDGMRCSGIENCHGCAAEGNAITENSCVTIDCRLHFPASMTSFYSRSVDRFRVGIMTPIPRSSVWPFNIGATSTLMHFFCCKGIVSVHGAPPIVRPIDE